MANLHNCFVSTTIKRERPDSEGPTPEAAPKAAPKKKVAKKNLALKGAKLKGEKDQGLSSTAPSQSAVSDEQEELARMRGQLAAMEKKLDEKNEKPMPAPKHTSQLAAAETAIVQPTSDSLPGLGVAPAEVTLSSASASRKEADDMLERCLEAASAGAKRELQPSQTHAAWVRFKRTYQDTTSSTTQGARSDKAPNCLREFLQSDAQFSKRWFEIWQKGDGKWASVQPSCHC